MTGAAVTTVDCPCCRGSGRAELSKMAGCAATAMCNRLAALERKGLVTSRRYGRLRLYRPLDQTLGKE